MLQVAEDLAAQVEHHLLSRPLHQVGLQEFQREGEKQQPNVEAADLPDTLKRRVTQVVGKPGVRIRRFRQVLVDGNLGEEWPQYVSHRLQNDGRQRHRHMPLVGTQIAQQPPHQPAVIRLSYYFVFLVRSHSLLETRAEN